MIRCISAVIFVLAAPTALAGGDPPMRGMEEVRALVGIEYLEDAPSVRIAPHLSCTTQGGGMLTIDGVTHDDWWQGFVDCQGRSVLTLERRLRSQEKSTTWRIVDAVLLPPNGMDPGPKRKNALSMVGMESCDLEGRPNTVFHVAARFGKRKRIDWRTGVKQAWTFDLEAGRIVPLPTRGIVCERLEL